MKRIKVRPGKFIFVSAEVVEKAAQAAAAVSYTREEAERIAAAEPRGMTIYAAQLRRIGRRKARSPAVPRQQSQSSSHQRVAAKVREMLGERISLATSFDVDAWVENWLQLPLPQLGGRSPAEVIDGPDSWQAVETALESMRGGLPG